MPHKKERNSEQFCLSDRYSQLPASHPGDILAKIPRTTTKTKDITGSSLRLDAAYERLPSHSGAHPLNPRSC